MKFIYMEEPIEVEMLTNINDHEHTVEQVLILRNLMFDQEFVRWGVRVEKGSQVPWSCLFEALTAALWTSGGLVRRYKKRMDIRRVAKYITGNAKGASAKSLRKAVLAALLKEAKTDA